MTVIRKIWDSIDEVVANNAHVHLERMDDDHWSLIISTETETTCLSLIETRFFGKDVRCFLNWQEKGR